MRLSRNRLVMGLVLLGALSQWIVPAAAQVEKASVRVDGMV